MTKDDLTRCYLTILGRRVIYPVPTKDFPGTLTAAMKRNRAESDGFPSLSSDFGWCDVAPARYQFERIADIPPAEDGKKVRDFAGKVLIYCKAS